MEALREDFIIIRGTGKRAKRLMDRLYVYMDVFPELYKRIRNKIYCIIDANPQKKDTLFYDIPVRSLDAISGCNGAILYVVAVADYLPIFDEIRSDNTANIRVITDNEFIHEISIALQNVQFRTHENGIKEGIKRIIQNEYDIGRIISDANKDNDALSINLVKALNFLQGDKVLTNDEILIKDVKANKISQDEKKVIGIFSTTIGGGGAERVISHLTKIFIEQGHKVVIFIERTDENEYNTQEGTEYVQFQYKLSDDFNMCMEERYKVLKEKKINVACFHIPYEGYMLFYEVLLCKLMRIRTSVVFHTSFINALAQRGGLLANRKIYLLADKLVVLSKTDEVFWRDKGVDAQYIPNPFNPSLANEKKTVEDGKNILLWVGKINQKYKRVFDLIPIMEEIKKRVPTAKLYVLGTVIFQEEADSFRKKIRDRGLEDNIVICGFEKNVEYYYRRASVMLMTSPGEGFPMALAEAKIFGLPTVMYNLPYLELVKDGQGIITVNKWDITRFAYEVVSLLENDNLRKTLSDKARKSAEYFMQYDIASAWKTVIEDAATREASEENKRKERSIIWQLIDENRIDIANEKKEEIRALDLEDRIRLQKKYHFVDWHLTPKVDKAYIDSIIKGIISLAENDETIQCITEVGCGLGDIIGDFLLDRFDRTAYDLNNDVIEACKERYEGRCIEWKAGSFNDIKGEKIDCFIAVNFIHSIKPEYLADYFKNIYDRNKVRYLFVDKVTGNYPFTHDFLSLLPAGVREISRFGPYPSDGGTRYILLFENEKYMSKEA